MFTWKPFDWVGISMLCLMKTIVQLFTKGIAKYLKTKYLRTSTGVLVIFMALTMIVHHLLVLTVPIT